MLRVTLLLLAALILPAGAAGQAVRESPEPAVDEAPDPSDLLGRARTAQRTYERRRVGYLPLARGSYAGSCDEYVGRFCTWYEEDDWHPEVEDPAIGELRAELLAVLDSVAEALPGDAWLLGQRVWYRTEAGDWAAAVEVARACGEVEPWWCWALEGFALHGSGRYQVSQEAFRRALMLMPPEQARRWRVPRWPVDGRLRSYLEDLPPDSLPSALERLWALADPLYLVEGNDRQTAHYARWTVNRIRDDARNPFQIPWSDDLDQLTVRHGWEIGWEREWSRNVFERDRVVGHKHPEGRDYMPSGTALADPPSAAPEDLRADRRQPRSLYAPDYAPVLLPAQGQVTLFPRGADLVVVATHFLPADTTFDWGHDHPRPWLEPGNQAGMPDASGVFLWPLGGGEPLGTAATGRTEGATLLRVPAGSYVLSAEAWSPERRRAGRHRVMVLRDTVPPDLPTLSDLLLLRGGAPEPSELEAALPHVLPRTEVSAGDGVGLAFEVNGLGRTPLPMSFRLEVQRADRGLLRRAGEFLGLVSRQASITVAWEEQSPGSLGPLFRWIDLELADAAPGVYEATLTLSLPGRASVRSGTRFAVVPAT